ncbi:hypothetical protein F5Y19DRAFT_485009 [Xylariaceae sp. FL1651]|nr:hypothetical protein F5Y19DRAFT_485009 [Xylariaceae sp. FL1651]
MATYLAPPPTPPPEPRLIATGVHGNCVFNDADDTHPAEVRHLSGRAVIRGPVGQKGKIHFPLMFLIFPGTVGVSSAGEPGWRLQVDCGQEGGQEDGPYGGNATAYTTVTRAEVYVGCNCIWTKDLDPEQNGTFQIKMDDLQPIALTSAEGLKGLEVTLTLKYGQSPMRFCSVGVVGVNLPFVPFSVRPE